MHTVLVLVADKLQHLHARQIGIAAAFKINVLAWLFT